MAHSTVYQIFVNHNFCIDQTPTRPRVDNVNFEDPVLWEHLQSGVNGANLESVLLHLALCHSIVVDDRSGRYTASSPDELALVNAAKFFGAEFLRRDEENILHITWQGKPLSYRLLNVLEFTSTRKRMSLLLEDLNGEGDEDVLVLTKGADSIIIPRLNPMKG